MAIFVNKGYITVKGCRRALGRSIEKEFNERGMMASSDNREVVNGAVKREEWKGRKKVQMMN